MKLRGLLALFSLIVIVKGNLFATAVKPIILGFGAILAAVDLDVVDVQPIVWKNWLPFVNKQSKSETKEPSYKELADRYEKE